MLCYYDCDCYCDVIVYRCVVIVYLCGVIVYLCGVIVYLCGAHLSTVLLVPITDVTPTRAQAAAKKVLVA